MGSKLVLSGTSHMLRKSSKMNPAEYEKASIMEDLSSKVVDYA